MYLLTVFLSLFVLITETFLLNRKLPLESSGFVLFPFPFSSSSSSDDPELSSTAKGGLVEIDMDIAEVVAVGTVGLGLGVGVTFVVGTSGRDEVRVDIDVDMDDVDDSSVVEVEVAVEDFGRENRAAKPRRPLFLFFGILKEGGGGERRDDVPLTCPGEKSLSPLLSIFL